MFPFDDVITISVNLHLDAFQEKKQIGKFSWLPNTTFFNIALVIPVMLGIVNCPCLNRPNNQQTVILIYWKTKGPGAMELPALFDVIWLLKFLHCKSTFTHCLLVDFSEEAKACVNFKFRFKPFKQCFDIPGCSSSIIYPLQTQNCQFWHIFHKWWILITGSTSCAIILKQGQPDMLERHSSARFNK